MHTKRWQDWFNLVLGAWLFISPWLIGYSSTAPLAAWSAWLCGAAVALLAGLALSSPEAWKEGANALLGAWVAGSPWLPGFVGSRDATSNAILAGALITLFALWALLQDQDIGKWWHNNQRAA